MRPELNFTLWQSPGMAVACILVVAAVAVVLAILFRYESRLVPRSVSVALMTLRFLVLLVLLLVLFQPTWIWNTRTEREGRVWIAVDTSQSMTVADEQAELAEKAVWAEGIGLISSFEAGQVEKLLNHDGPADPNDVPVEEVARLANLRQTLEDVGEMSRLELTARLLRDAPAGVLEQLSKRFQVQLSGFDQDARVADESVLDEWHRNGAPTADAGSVTRLEAGLTPENMGDKDSPLLGAIVFTDGRDNSSGDPLRAAATLRQAEVPVYVVPLGTRRPARDLAVLKVDAPPTVLHDDNAQVTATVSTHGFEGEKIEIELSSVGDAADRLIDEPLIVSRQPSGASTTVKFDVPGTIRGRHELKVRVSGAGREIRDDNNERQFALTVVDDRLGVLLADGPARWEFRYLHAMFERDPRVRLTPVLFEQPNLGLLDVPFLLPDWPFNANENAEPLPEIDLVIFGDVPPESVSAADWDMLHRFVTEQGGTLVFLPGTNSFPGRYRAESLSRILPVRDIVAYSAPGGRLPGRGGFGLKLSIDGMQESVLQLGAPGENPADVWSSFPGHRRLWVGQSKPGASVWVEAVDSGEQPSLDRSRRNAVMVHANYGMGQVLWVGLSDTWRWRFRAGDKYQHRFWGQISRWAADTKALAAHGFVRFGPERSDVSAGNDVVIAARFSQPFLTKNPRPEADVVISAVEADGRITPRGTVPITAVNAESGNYQAVATGLPPGEYRLRLEMTDEALRGRVVEAPLFVREPPSAELSDLTVNEALLADIAKISGGDVFAANEMERLLSMFGDWEQTQVSTNRRSAWDNGFVLAILFALLTIEWVIRKLNGLP